MANLKRRTGGRSNKKENRYEDFFAVCRCIELAPEVVFRNRAITLSEQAACPVDDLVVQEDEKRHYYQLKDDRSISWGRRKSKLTREFEVQKVECRDRKEIYSLNLVVSHPARKKFLEMRMPKSLKALVAVRHFPAFVRPSDLSRWIELRPILVELAASRSPGDELLENLCHGFYNSWLERRIDADGTSELAQMIEWMRSKPALRMIRTLPSAMPPEWDRFAEILGSIPELAWYIDRGYFEWIRRFESGLLQHPCDGAEFRRFVERVVQKSPSKFEDFEVLL